jgi:hypothetical protein
MDLVNANLMTRHVSYIHRVLFGVFSVFPKILEGDLVFLLGPCPRDPEQSQRGTDGDYRY